MLDQCRVLKILVAQSSGPFHGQVGICASAQRQRVCTMPCWHLPLLHPRTQLSKSSREQCRRRCVLIMPQPHFHTFSTSAPSPACAGRSQPACGLSLTIVHKELPRWTPCRRCGEQGERRGVYACFLAREKGSGNQGERTLCASYVWVTQNLCCA